MAFAQLVRGSSRGDDHVIRRVVIGAMLLVMVAASPAAAQYDDFTITPGSVQPGGTVTVTGQGCSPGAEVTITLTEGDTSAAKAAGDVIATTTVTADEDGRFNTTITVPAGTPPGTYSVDATCDGVLVGHAVIDVVDATRPPRPPRRAPAAADRSSAPARISPGWA